MRPAQRAIVVRGLNRLLHEIVVHALSTYDLPRHPSCDTNLEDEADIVLMFSRSIESDINTVRLVRAEAPTAKIVVAGVRENTREFIRLVEEGISASVAETSGLADLVDTLQQVRQNRASCTGPMTRLLLKRISSLSRQESSEVGSQLTSREKEVLYLISDGLSNKEISARLQITPNTVKNHVHHLLEKLKMNSRHEAAAWTQMRSSRSFPIAVSAVKCKPGLERTG